MMLELILHNYPREMLTPTAAIFLGNSTRQASKQLGVCSTLGREEY